MPRRTIPGLLLLLWAMGLAAQDLDHIQIHGFATQGFLFGKYGDRRDVPHFLDPAASRRDA